MSLILSRAVRPGLLLLAAILAAGFCPDVVAAEPAATDTRGLYLHTFGSQGTLRFELIDHIKTPQYHWPRTLLTYPVRFEAKVRPGQLSLRDAGTGKPVPFQLSSVELSNGLLAFAEVNFFGDLPSGGKRQYELFTGASSPTPAEVKLVKEDESYVLDEIGRAHV